MSLDSALKDFEGVLRGSSATAESLQDLIDIPQSEWDKFAEHAAESVKSEVRGYFVGNYRKSGMKVRTGKTLRAIRRLDVFFSKKGRTEKLVFALPPGVKGYKSGKKESNFYVVTVSNNYGSVKTKGDFKQKAKKKVKKKLLSKKNAFVKGHTFKADSVSVGKKSINSISVGGAQSITIVQPKSFFGLNSSQAGIIIKKFHSEVSKQARDYIGL